VSPALLVLVRVVCVVVYHILHSWGTLHQQHSTSWHNHKVIKLDVKPNPSLNPNHTANPNLKLRPKCTFLFLGILKIRIIVTSQLEEQFLKQEFS
jgi:hypothetical protein